MNKILFYKIFKKWDQIDGNQEKFISYLKRNGWKELKSDGLWKIVFSKDKYILKFDVGMKMDDNIQANDKYSHVGYDAEMSHTSSEYRSWQRSKNRPRGQYIVPALLYHRGLLVQPFLSRVNDNINTTDPKVKDIARQFRFSHYWGYGYLKGKLKFFDTDSLGSNWWNWRKI